MQHSDSELLLVPATVGLHQEVTELFDRASCCPVTPPTPALIFALPSHALRTVLFIFPLSYKVFTFVFRYLPNISLLWGKNGKDIMVKDASPISGD